MSKRPFTVDRPPTPPPTSVQPQPAAPQPEPLVTDGEWGVFPATPQPQPDPTPPPSEPPTPPVRRKRKGHTAELDALIILTVVWLWGWASIAALPPRPLIDTVVTGLMAMLVATVMFVGGMFVLGR